MNTAPIHSPAGQRTVNPHYRADGCASCHVVAGGRAQPIEQPKVEALCLSCHDGKRASEEAHPVFHISGIEIFTCVGKPA